MVSLRGCDGMTLNENTTTKKTRRKRAITLVDGVEGTEISLYTKSLKEPSIKIFR